MIHELLLCLSGHPSPLLEGDLTETDRQERVKQNNGIRALIDPAELVLLQKLALGLGKRNREIRENASRVSATHPSTVCRAVAAAIVSDHLRRFREKIMHVERDILIKNSNIVGAHNTVPLSAVVSAFDGWERKLQWLLDITIFIRHYEGPDDAASPGVCSAAAIIQKLRDATFTGFSDIAAMAVDLTGVAELTWLKQLSAWVIYGRLLDSIDLFVTRLDSGGGTSRAFTVDQSLIPCFVTASTANSILFIGKSLNNIRDRKASATDRIASRVAETAFLSAHLARLSELTPPITSTSFTAAISGIRLSLSQNALQKLLPIAKVIEALHVLKDYFLLERGEFAVALITAADNRLSQQHRKPIEKRKKDVESLNDLASLTIRDGEVQAVLSRTWTALTSINETEADMIDEEVDRARELITLSIKTLKPQQENDQSNGKAYRRSVNFDDLLLPTPTVLSFRIHAPIDLFLSSEDVHTYSQVQSYLLALRRCHMHLSQLFLLSSLRRESTATRNSSKVIRFKNLVRNMRPIWITIQATVHFLAEVTGYLQGEVVKSSWATFQAWVTPEMDATPLASSMLSSSFRPESSHINSRPVSSRQSDEVATWGVHDPDTLASAHRKFLDALCHSLLLDDMDFTSTLRRQMSVIDHLCGLMQRLSDTHTSLTAMHSDNEESHFAQAERSILAELMGTQANLAAGTEKLISRLRAIDDARSDDRDMEIEPSHLDQNFMPWTPNGLDRLLLKFDFVNSNRLLAPAFNGG